MDLLDLLPIFLLLLVVFVNRYLIGTLLRMVKRKSYDEVDDTYEPTVAVVIPLFNEGKGIYETLQSLLRMEYPADKLRIVVVDDCSTDDSLEWARKAASEDKRVLVLRNPVNMGKRRGINHAVRNVNSEIIVSVDSDVMVDPQAVRRLVRRFVSPEIAAVGGRVRVSNADQNWLTRMQTVKYYFGYEFLKNLERAFSTVMCLSGCLTAYRRHVLLELEPVLETRAVFDVAIKYGEDRFLTRQIIKAGYNTRLTLDAECWTVVPDTLDKYFNQQLRWRRSNFIDFVCGLSHAWRLNPLVCLHYLALFGMLVSYPLIIIHNLLAGTFFDLAAVHLAFLAALGVIYWVDTRKLPREQRVHPLWFLSMAVVMPVTYILYTPLAMFTLDSSSWETRGHVAPAAEPEPVPLVQQPVMTAGGEAA
jgi:cellulose synthase/poly-beta-1,6-N-acetylglucosamine synthase-like glycosyltransferase